METITVSATRTNTFSMTDMELLVGSAVVIVVIAWMVFARMRRDRPSRQA